MGNSWGVRIEDCHLYDNGVRGRDDQCFDLGGLNHVMTIQGSDILVRNQGMQIFSLILSFACTHWQLDTLLGQPLNNQPSKPNHK
ncbi:hypothetical protein EJB05_09397, partial [Eragrostis curvula]